VARGPSELLVKIYGPDGRPAVREVIPDDGVNALGRGPLLAGWDHEAWYYETCHSRGLEPLQSWSSSSDPTFLAACARRSFTYTLKGGGKGVYRIILAGSPDLYISAATEPELAIGVNGGPDWVHGHHDLYRRRFLCVPRGTVGLSLGLLELDQPRGRRLSLKTTDGKPVVLKRGDRPVAMALDGSGGYATASGDFDNPDAYAGRVLVLEVGPGTNDYFLGVDLLLKKEQRNWRGSPPRVPAVLCPDEATAKAVNNGALEHDGQVFWQMNQIRLWDWLKTLKPEDFAIPAGLPVKPDFISVGSHESPFKSYNNKQLAEPRPGAADILMYSYGLHTNRQALNVALTEMLEGMRLIGPNDHVLHGRNLAYEMGCYSYFYHRPAWRILRQSEAPAEAKEAVREFAMQIGDRMPFCRGIELVNGNSLASLVQAMRYIVEATEDPLHRQLFDTYWDRFANGGFGKGVGIGVSGGVQEGYGYDQHYGTYVLSGWRAGLADLNDPRFRKAYNTVQNLYSYIYSMGANAAPYSSRTKNAVARYDAWQEGPYRWKGAGGADLTESVNGGNEFFAARRKGYYAVAYYGRLTPSWLGEGFHGQIGYGGGGLCQLHIPGKGQVLAATLNGDYGSGMHPSQWRTFRLHSVVGETADGQPLVTANSEPANARLDGVTVSGYGEVRQSSVTCERGFTFGPGEILCSVRLAGSGSDRVFNIYGGAHGLRGMVREAYEMIPFTPVTVPAGRGKPPVVKTRVTLLNGQGETLGPLTLKPVMAAAVLVDQGGYGVRIELDRVRPVQAGERDTILVDLVPPAGGAVAAAGKAAPAEGEEPAEEGAEAGSAKPAGRARAVPAEAIFATYRLVPFSDEAPLGAIRPVESVEPGMAAAVAPAPAAAPVEARPLTAIQAADAAALVGALEAVRPIEVRTAKGAIAEIRAALAGVDLAVEARVKDPKPVVAETAWKGACVEVFGSQPGGAAIGQIFLTPAAGGQPARAFAAKGGRQSPAPEVRVTGAAADGGYAIRALIPLSLLAIDGKSERFFLEFQVNMNTEGGPLHVSAFGSTRAYMDSSAFGVFKP
jgi:hypothetical protein